MKKTCLLFILVTSNIYSMEQYGIKKSLVQETSEKNSINIQKNPLDIDDSLPWSYRKADLFNLTNDPKITKEVILSGIWGSYRRGSFNIEAHKQY